MKFEVEISQRSMLRFKRVLRDLDYDPKQLKDDLEVFKEFFYQSSHYEELDLRERVKVRRL